MGTICRKRYTRPLPEGAEIRERKGVVSAVWRDSMGRKRTAPLTRDGTRVVLETRTWMARYYDARGRLHEVSTRCRDEQTARYVLAAMERKVEHVKAGIMTPQQARTADHAYVPVLEHVEAYLEHLKVKTVGGKRVSEQHRLNVKRQLWRLVQDQGYSRLADISRESMERWSIQAEESGMGARTRNTYLAAIMAFCNWCAATDRLAASPLIGLCKADVRSDLRRARRALTEEEIARLRPVAEYGRQRLRLPPNRRRGRSTWARAPLSYDTLEAAYERGREALKGSARFLVEQERLGRERSLIYKVLTLTGLRKGELASITVRELHLDAPQPYVEVLPKDEKAGRGARIPLRADLASDLHEHLERKLAFLQQEAREAEGPIPLRLPLNEPLCVVPGGFIRVFDRDLEEAGIAKHDERGRTVDIHALRHAFGTHLSKNGVAPRTAQAAMRHSKLELTMNVYTDPELLDVAGAVEALPALTVPESGERSVSRHA